MEARIQALLSGQNLHVALADVDSVADDLRRVHKEYQRRKLAAMKLQVGRVLERMAREASPLRELMDGGLEEDEREDEEGMGGEVSHSQQGNGMNASLTGMYAAVGTAQAGPGVRARRLRGWMGLIQLMGPAIRSMPWVKVSATEQ